jgi:hypothetical protein
LPPTKILVEHTVSRSDVHDVRSRDRPLRFALYSARWLSCCNSSSA